ncbi:MAG TPA: RidA family protein [Pyrinomonadaceae bacterium]|jgi:2-iminobutanoate/2-iminopropanoate deaminase|nr:RidA family protein [Pyrinomonadaceae bacterium]
MIKPILYAVVVISMLFVPQVRTEKKVILPPGAKPSGNWSYGMLADGTLYVSGMGGEDASGKIPASFEAEVQQSLDNIDKVLKAAGMSSANVVSVQVYITDRDTFGQMNKVYTSYFKDPRPTRTTVVVAGLVGDGHIEITVTAKKF